MPLAKLSCEEIKEGVSFSAPVFFEDAVNMFLAANKPVKGYHVAAIERWKVPYLLTAGHKNEGEPVIDDEVFDMEELDDLEEVGEVEEL